MANELISDSQNELPRVVNAVYKETYLRNGKSRCVHFQGTEPAEVMHNRGALVCNWQQMANLTGTAIQTSGVEVPQYNTLAELTGTAVYGQNGGSNRPADQLGVTQRTATAAKYGNHVILNEEADLINPSTQMDKIMEVIGINAGDSLDKLQSIGMNSEATLVYAGGVASEGAVVSKITLAAIKSVINTLDKGKATTFSPMATGSQNFGSTMLMPGFIGITHPDVAMDVTQLAGFKPAETYAGQVALMLGEYGAITAGGRTVRFVSAHNADVEADAGGLTGSTGLISETGTNIDTYTTLIYGQAAFGSVGFGSTYGSGSYRAGEELEPIELVVSGLTPSPADPYGELQSIAWKAWHADVELNPAWNRGIVSGATSL
jgi:N4-gp56 family major capsid protein